MFGKKEANNDYGLFAIYDSKTQAYRLPMPQKSAAILVRELEKLFADPSQNANDLVTHSEDFSLFKIAEYDSLTGRISPIAHEHIANVHELRAKAHASMAAQSKIPDLRALSTT